MKEIELVGGLVALVDDEDFEEINKYKWTVHHSKRSKYAVRDIYKDGTHIRRRMHTEILGISPIDHIDSNGLNNQKSNLRACTQKQNSMNTRSHIDSTSKYKGVSWVSKYKKWRSEIYFNGKTIYLGWFDDEIVAAKEYDKKSLELFGEWGKTNFEYK